MNKFLRYVLGVSMLLNLAVAFLCYNHESRFLDPDSNDYIQLADSLALFHGYTKGDEPEIFRTPGYSFFLAPFRYIFPHSFFPIIIFQSILGTISVFLLWSLVLSLTHNNLTIAKIAVIFQVISLPSIVAVNKILSETLFTFLLLLSLFLLNKTLINIKDKTQSNSNKKYLFAAATGTIAGLTLLVRAIFLPLFPLFILYLYFQGSSYIQKENKTLIYKIILIMLLPYILTFAGWKMRNHINTGYNGFSSVASINIYRYYACALLARQKGISFSQQQKICDANLSTAGNQVQQANYAIKHGLPILKSAPFTYLFIHIKTDINTLLPAVGDLYALIGKNIGGKGTLSVINSKGIIAGIKYYFSENWTLFFLALPIVFILILKYMLALIGVAKTILTKEILLTSLLYILLITYMILIPGTVSHPRFRVPVDPLLSLFAAVGLYYCSQLLKSKIQHSIDKKLNSASIST